MDGQLHFKGAYGNCSWGGSSNRCTFRLGPLPLHIYTLLLKVNPDSLDLKRGSDAKPAKGEKRKIAPAPVATGSLTLVGKKRGHGDKRGSGSASKRARTTESESVRKPGPKKTPKRPDYNPELYSSALLDPAIR